MKFQETSKKIILLLVSIFSIGIMAQVGTSNRQVDIGVHEYAEQVSTPANPGAGKFKVYVKDGQLKLLNDSGVEVAIGSGGGGISEWETATGYTEGDIVFESTTIYKCLTTHTSGTFATDLAASKWVMMDFGYTAEDTANKATDFTTINDTLYPTVQAVETHIIEHSGSFKVFILSGVNSDISGYESMPLVGSYTPGALATAAVSISTSPTLLEEFATASGSPSMAAIPIGTGTIHYEIERTSGTATYTTYAEVYSRTTGGTETLLATSDTSPSYGSGLQQVTLSFLITSIRYINSTDRIVLKIYATSNSGTPQVTLKWDNSTDARVSLPSSTLDYTPEPAFTTLPLSKGGTNKNITASAGAVAYSDSDSIELTAVGSSGQPLVSNGTAAPAFGTIDLASTAAIGSSVLGTANGGTAKAITPSAGKVVYSDADSFELSAVGTSGQVLQSNGTSAPAFADPYIPTTTLSNTSSVTNSTSLAAPNTLMTEYESGKRLIESGNNNILANPSFEHSTYSTSWTTSGTGTFSEETSVVFAGKKAAKVVTSSQTFGILQDSTLYQAQYADGVQCEASVRLKTNSTVAPVICARQAGTTSTVDCVTASTDNVWAQYTIPFICKGTSNGITIDGASATGTTYIDDVYVGPIKNYATSSQIGPWRTGTCTSTVTTNATTTCKYRVNGDSMDVQWLVTFSGVNTQGTVVPSLPSGYTVNTSKLVETGHVGSVRVLDSSTSIVYKGVTRLSIAGSFTAQVIRDNVNTNPSYIDIVNIATSSNIPITIASGDTIEINAYGIPVNELNGNVSTYSAPCGTNCENVFSAQVDSAGAVLTENLDWINGSFSKSSSRYTASLNGTFGSAMACTCTVLMRNGDYNCTATASTTQVIVDIENNAVAADEGFQVMCQKQSTDYQLSRSIVGSFKDNVVSKDSGQLNVRVGDVTCSSSSTIGQNVGSWISSIGNVSAGNCTITVASGVFGTAPSCMATVVGTNSAGTMLNTTASSATSMSTDCKNDASSDCTSYQARLLCWEDL